MITIKCYKCKKYFDPSDMCQIVCYMLDSGEKENAFNTCRPCEKSILLFLEDEPR